MNQMATAPFFYHPRMLSYDFGPKHPLKPERLRRTMELIQWEAPDLAHLDPGLAEEEDILRVHSEEFVGVVKELSARPEYRTASAFTHGFSKLDTPPFEGMWESSLSYCGGALRAAEAVRDGAPLAFSMSGGLHHAKRERANGFCVLSDPALAVVVLREKFERVLYVDIDLHHGDGPQAIFYDDPSVMTFSIHETGRSLYPGTGFEEEEGVDRTAINLPLPAGTEGQAWLHAFTRTLDLAVKRFDPQGIVLQMGCDPHTLDPLGHLRVSVQHWLGAVAEVSSKGLPIVALGGGGYHLPNVPRMWVGAILTLLGRQVPARVPEQTPKEWGMTTYLDADEGGLAGMNEAERLVEHWTRRLS